MTKSFQPKNKNKKTENSDLQDPMEETPEFETRYVDIPVSQRKEKSISEMKEKTEKSISEMKEKTEKSGFSWMIPLKVMLFSLYSGQVQACSISNVRDELRDSNKAAFKPEEVSIGPLHRGTTRRVQLVEETKWRYMREFLEREGTLEQNQRSSWQRLEDCGTSMKKLQTAIMASYGGNIESEPDELFKILIVDGCFLLELLMRLRYNSSSSYSNDPVLGNEEKLVSILNDITMLENQIPFIVLKKLYRKVFPHPDGSDIENDHRAAKIVQEAFHYPVVNNFGAVHMLHLMHLSTVEQNQHMGKRVKQELWRCATRLRAAGITIKAANTTTGQSVDWFNFEISFTGSVLQIPPLNVKGATEVRWRNLIAWEQSSFWIRCKYTSYALFFQGLVCCKHDIELLEEKKVIVNDAGKSKEELLNLFRTISKGAELMDSSYEGICYRLNKFQGKKVSTIVGGVPIVTWHECRHVFEIIAYYWGNWYSILIRDHMPTVWKRIGLLAAAMLLVLTFIQTYYSSRGRS